MATGTSSQGAAAMPQTSDQLKAFIAAMNQGGTGTNAFQYQPKTTTITDLTQTSQPDITSIINGTMQQLLGRNATADEIKNYGAELLAAERANTGQYSAQLQYSSQTGKPLVSTGTQLVAGVNPADFIANIIRGTGEAKQYNIMNTYMGALQNLADQFKGSYNG